MLSIRSSADLVRALASPLDDELKRLLIRHRDQLSGFKDYDLGELVHFVIIDPGDIARDIEPVLGFDPTINPSNGARFGEPDFESSWEWLEHHQHWTELVFVLSDDGFGVVLFIPHRDDVDEPLTALCRAHA